MRATSMCAPGLATCRCSWSSQATKSPLAPAREPCSVTFQGTLAARSMRAQRLGGLAMTSALRCAESATTARQ
ncbi:MAG TPA: hypothetical protein EYP98_17800 [Planctomycetes bacterium]|nr:hypothetical protein [Planctomycetota bacterium]